MGGPTVTDSRSVSGVTAGPASNLNASEFKIPVYLLGQVPLPFPDTVAFGARSHESTVEGMLAPNPFVLARSPNPFHRAIASRADLGIAVPHEKCAVRVL